MLLVFIQINNTYLIWFGNFSSHLPTLLQWFLWTATGHSGQAGVLVLATVMAVCKPGKEAVTTRYPCEMGSTVWATTRSGACATSTSVQVHHSSMFRAFLHSFDAFRMLGLELWNLKQILTAINQKSRAFLHSFGTFRMLGLELWNLKQVSMAINQKFRSRSFLHSLGTFKMLGVELI